MSRRLLLRVGTALGLLLLAWAAERTLRVPNRPSPAPSYTEAAAPTEIRYPAIGFRDAARLAEHFGKHGREFGAITQPEYLRRAQRLRDRPAGGDILEAVRGDGVITRFDRGAGDFLAVDPDLVIRTFFRPNDGEAYFQRQLKREYSSP